MKKVFVSLCIIAVLALVPVSLAHAADFNIQSLFAQIAALVNRITRTASFGNGYQVAQVASSASTLTKVSLSPSDVSYVVSENNIPQRTWYYKCRNYNLVSPAIIPNRTDPRCINTDNANTAPINLWPNNLVDGNIGTQAYASDFRFGYDIPLSPAPQYSPIDLSGGKIVINWGPYGYSPYPGNNKPYMNDWYVWGYVPSTNKWVQIAGEPNAPCNNSRCINDARTIMIPNTPLVVSKIRVTSGWGYNGSTWTSNGFRRAGNWIGLREVEVYTPQPVVSAEWKLLATSTPVVTVPIYAEGVSTISASMTFRVTARGGVLQKPTIRDFGLAFASSTQTTYVSGGKTAIGNGDRGFTSWIDSISPTDASVGDGADYTVTVRAVLTPRNSDGTSNIGGISANYFFLATSTRATVSGQSLTTQRESNWQTYSTLLDAGGTSATPVCGNRIPEGTESCDDGNNIDTDFCRNSCKIGFGCTLGPVSQGHVAGEILVRNSCSSATASTSWARYSASVPPLILYSSNYGVLSGASNACLRDAIAAINNGGVSCFSGAEPNYTGSL